MGVNFAEMWDGLISLALGFCLLLSTGLFVADFIGAEVITTDLKGEERWPRKPNGKPKQKRVCLIKSTTKCMVVSKRLAEAGEKIGGQGR